MEMVSTEGISEEEVCKALMKAGGKLATEDEKTFTEITSKLIEVWDIKRPQEVMLVNRFVSTWMKMLRIEELMGKYDLFFEQKDKDGALIGIKINQLAYYLKSLESDFRNYYKVIQGDKAAAQTADGPKDFGAFLEAKKVEDGDESL